jgi:hypothetical protein
MPQDGEPIRVFFFMLLLFMNYDVVVVYVIVIHAAITFTAFAYDAPL